MKSICNAIKILFLSVTLVSCCPDSSDSPRLVEQKMGSGGDFIIINVGTNDTLRISGAINLSGFRPILTAYNGNVIKIAFEPKEENKDYVFTTKYTLPHGEVIENFPEYDYVVEDSLKGLYYIDLSAISKGETKQKKWHVTAGGAFILNVVVQ